MEKKFFENMPAEDKARLGYIEGREELWKTKLLKILTENNSPEKINNVLVATRDPGSANALLPVLKELLSDEETQITTLTDGKAEEIILKNFQTEDITPEGSPLGFDSALPPLQAILMDLSSGEMGLDTYVAARFSETPKVLVEDYYSTANILLEMLVKRGLPFPAKICVMDQGAKDIIIKKFPDLEDNIEITGQPAFDRFTNENTEEITSKVRSKLGLKETDSLVTYMSTMDELEKIKQMAQALKNSGRNFYFAFRKHPRDNIEYSVYKKILTDAGIVVIDTNDFTSDEIGAASDVVLTTWSTAGLEGIYRRKPTAHIIDTDFNVPKGLELPLVPAKLGASIELDNMDQLSGILPKLLDANSELNVALRASMKKNYPTDGKNAWRVANIIRQYTKQK